MASDEESDLEELLGRVSKKLGWQNIQHVQEKDVKLKTRFRKPSENSGHRNKKKSVRNSSKKVPRKSKKDTSSSSDKENGVKGPDHDYRSSSKSNPQANANCRVPSDLFASPCSALAENPKCVERGNSIYSTDISKEGGKIDYEKGLDLNNGVSESNVIAQSYLVEPTRNLQGSEVAVELNDRDPVSDSKHEECLQISSETVLKADENVTDVFNSDTFENASSVSSDVDDLANDTSHEPSSPIPKDNTDDLDKPFSPFQCYSETLQPMKWLLTPPPKENQFKASLKSAEKISMVAVSDSESNSSCDLYALNCRKDIISSPMKETELEIPISPSRCDLETPNFAHDSFKATQSVEQTITVNNSVLDSPDNSFGQIMSLTERLSKNFKRQRGLSRPSEKEGLDTGSPTKHRTMNEDTRILNEVRAPGYVSSEDEDEDRDFEQFLQAIKTPHHEPHSVQTPNPSRDEEQYEDSFIDDTPIESRDSDEDVYYYRHINSDRKIFSNRKKELDTKPSSTPQKYRLPEFSDSDDADDSVFATPKPPVVRVPKPSNGCHSSSPYVNDFKNHRDVLTRKLFILFNKTVFDNKLPSDFSIKWNNRMRKTAGFCYYTKTKVGGLCSARIELSEKVCDTAERLRDTLIHELCHAACWMINGVNDGHGRFWKYWAAKANHAHPSLPIIKRCHSYEITTKYKYQCVRCKTTIGRHSKSINTDKYCCTYCKGNLVLLPSLNKDGKVSKARTPNKFALFVKENYGSMKRNNASMKHADIMRLLSQDFSKKATISV
ncbi:acidic repeat-containing protein-like isoform X2 [Acanthaster planci]|uniref:Acidic repeat-containing protein-like isoform X2 n=1 Tax=Acanthaster planci TaxID=133434 RepID=A0A8B7Z057_ACAPL|nr:acidic repeat-containing protein-like isoform X2 [Acanthaster planci]